MRWFHRFSHTIMVPTPMVKRDLEHWGFRDVALWSRGVALDVFKPRPEPEGEAEAEAAPRVRSVDGPIFLYAGRVAVEKNIEAFLSLDLPGQKWVGVTRANTTI
jgi:hypothetical protein